jgi:triacylglycerol esterase/lipase EstA (alpha/beta hydrolase family)
VRYVSGGAVFGPYRARLVVVGVSSLVAALLGVLIFAGESDARTNVPPFLVREGAPPPGANIACKPTKQHPHPVVLVHGTFETMEQNWAVLAPRLKQRGYCVFALNYGNRGLGPIQDSAQELGTFVDNVLRYTGARKVSLVGHSQGGMMPRFWIKNLGGKSKVADMVGIAPSNYGTELSQPDFRAALGISNPCTACEQQKAGSRFLRNLNRGDDTPGPGSFTQIATDDDEIIIPYTRCFLRGTERTSNITLQRYNGGLPVTHQNIYNDPFAQRLVFDALANPGPANPARAFSAN